MAAPENNVRELTLKRQEMKSKKRYCLEDDKKVNHRVVIFIVEPGMSRQETFRHASQGDGKNNNQEEEIFIREQELRTKNYYYEI